VAKINELNKQNIELQKQLEKTSHAYKKPGNNLSGARSEIEPKPPISSEGAELHLKQFHDQIAKKFDKQKKNITKNLNNN